jgi:hypothetical protein
MHYNALGFLPEETAALDAFLEFGTRRRDIVLRSTVLLKECLGDDIDASSVHWAAKMVATRSSSGVL